MRMAPFNVPGVRRADQAQLVELYRVHASSATPASHPTSSDPVAAAAAAAESRPSIDSPDHESGRIKKLEKLIKRRL